MATFLRPGRMRPLTLLRALVLVTAFAPPLHAQREQLSLPVGTRVRVTESSGAEPFTGNVLRLTRDTLAVSAGAGNVLIQLPRTRLTSLEVSDGRNRLGWGLGGAAIGGLGGGLIIGVVLGRQEPGTLAGLAGFIAGGIIGTVTGAVAGAVIAPERWHRMLSSYTHAPP